MFKKQLAILLSVVFLFSIISVFPISAKDLLGDVNSDGSINQYDYILVKRHYFGTYSLSATESVLADVNRDKRINQYDYVLIKRHYFGTYTISQPDNDESSGDNDVILEQVPNIVSAGKQYTASPSASASYEDTYNAELTDGVYGKSSSYSAGVFCGYSSNVIITVDLKDDGIDLNKFEMSVLSTSDAGINLPSSIAVYGSDTQSDWNKLGNMIIPEYKEGVVLRASLELEVTVSYRYIRYEVYKKASWVFIDEIFVYSSIPKFIESTKGKLEQIYNKDATTDSVINSNVNSVFSGKNVNTSIGMAPVSAKCDYTINSSSYDFRTGNPSNFLTNGNITGSAFEREVWVGINAEKATDITVDLGVVRDDVFAFKLHAFNRPSSSINLPDYVDISVSNNGTSFVKIGRSYAIDSDQENYAFTISLDKCVNARYVRFSMPKGNGYAWVEEVEVYANTKDESKIDGMYSTFDFVTTSTPSYWENGSDYYVNQNLILGLPQQIVSNGFISYEEGDRANTPETSTILTDGQKTNDDYCYNGEWFHFVSGDGRSIYYDLGHISSISSFSVRLLDYPDWAIHLPDNVKLVLSEDGKNWYVAASVTPASNDDTIVDMTYTLGKPYRARYAMIYLQVGVHVFLDEITVNGTKNTFGASSLSALEKYSINVGEYESLGYTAPDDSLLGGAEDICLIYHNAFTANESYFKPYVAYTDKDGNIVDTLFDGYLFLPSTAPLPSGGRPYGTNYASDWNGLFDQLFKSGVNFDALNKTAETTKKSLGIGELKLKVYVAIPHMDVNLYDFGDIDLDGDNESLTTLEGRVYVARAYAERVIEEFDAMGYQNLELCGFYWFHEEISGADVETSKAVNAMFDEIGYQLFWIPYFNASGYSRWEEFGFDVCCYQPNYAFSITVDKSRLPIAVDAALRYGMCLEIETDDSALGDIRFFQKYMDYLSYGVDYGYMNGAIHMYYQSIGLFGKASLSDDSRVRLLYDYTYQFIKGILDNEPDVLPTVSVSGKMNTTISGTLVNESNPLTIYRVSNTSSHGTVSISENGEFVYYPNKEFKGTDSFTYQISNYLGWSEECTVIIEVE